MLSNVPFELKIFRENFCNFDINSVNLQLNIVRNYNNMSKEEFVYVLAKWFEELKERGNTELFNIKSNCTSNFCCNKGCEVIIFVADKTREHLAFNFDVFQHRIINIMECRTFNFSSGPEMKIAALKKYRKDFWEPTGFYEQCIKELYPHLDYVPNIEEIKYWFEKLEYNEVNGIYNKEFGLIQDCMESYIKLYDVSEHVESAMYELQKTNMNEEAEALEWLIHNEKAYFDSYLSEDFSELLSQPNTVVTFANHYKIDVSQLKIIEGFHEAYFYAYENACDKFADLYNDQWFCEEYESLFYALKKLELIKDYDEFPLQEICKVDRLKLKAYNEKIINSN